MPFFHSATVHSVTLGFAVAGVVGLALPLPAAGQEWESSVGGCTVTPDLLCDASDTDVDSALYDSTCIRLTVECGATEQYDAEVPRTVLLLKHFPVNTPYEGTIVFGSGGPGSMYYEDEGDQAVPLVESILAAGFVVIQRKWQGGGSKGIGGMRSISRHGSAMFDYIRNGPLEFFEGPRFCATGNSGGAAEIAFALTHHGFDGGLGSTAAFDGVVLTSGPPPSDLVTGCWGHIPEVNGIPLWWDPRDPTNPDSPSQLQGTPRPDFSDPENPIYPFCYDRLDQDGVPFEIDPDNPTLFEAWAGVFSEFARGIIDDTFGGEAICNLDQPSSANIERVAGAGLLGSTAVYNYPITNVYVLFGEEDCGEAVPLGLLYANKVATHIEFVPGAEHLMADSVTGVEAIRDALLLACDDPLCDETAVLTRVGTCLTRGP